MLAVLLEGVAPELLVAPVNMLRVSLHPEGLAPRIVNLAQWRAHVHDRLARQVAVSGDPRLAALLDELRSYPPGGSRPGETDLDRDGAGVLVPLQVETAAGVLSFFSTTTVFGTAVEVTLSEIAIESFFPADAGTAETLRAIAASLARASS